MRLIPILFVILSMIFVVFPVSAAGGDLPLDGKFYVRDWTPGAGPDDFWLPASVQNRVANCSFETGDLGPWSQTHGSPVVITDNSEAYHGDCFLRLENVAGEYVGVKQFVDLESFDITPGDRVSFSAAIKLSTGYYCSAWSGGDVTLRIRWLGEDAGGYYDIANVTYSAAGSMDSWTRASSLFTVPDDAVVAQLQLLVAGIPLFETESGYSAGCDGNYLVDFDGLGFYEVPQEEEFVKCGGTRWETDDLFLKLRVNPIDNGWRIRGRLRNTEGTGDVRRALDIGFYVPVESQGTPVWHNGFTESVDAPSGIHTASENVDRYANWPVHSHYPFSALETDDQILSLGMRLNIPRVCHTAYDGDQGRYFVEFHLGLLGSGETMYEPYNFAFDLLQLPTGWGFRTAAESWLAGNADAIGDEDRAPNGGIGDPAHDGWVDHLLDMGARYYQTIGYLGPEAEPFIPLLYTCSWTQRFPFADVDYLDYDEIMEEYGLWLEDTSHYSSQTEWDLLHGLHNSIMGNAGGDAVISENVACLGDRYCLPLNLNPELIEPNAATATLQFVDTMYGSMDYAGVEGDLYMQINRHMDYSEEHLSGCDNKYGLVYGLGTLTPAAWGGLSDLIYADYLRDEISATVGPLLAGNLVTHGFGHAALAIPFLDVAGFECGAFRGYDFNGSPEEQLFRRFVMNHRSMCRIYCPLDGRVEDYVSDGDEVQIFDELSALASFYGFYPSLTKLYANTPFSNWIDPKAGEYGILGDTVAKYVPVLDSVNSAGWQPVTGALSSNEAVWIERFGPSGESGDVYLTVLNNSSLTVENEEAVSPELSVEAERVHLTVPSLNDLELSGNLVLREAFTNALFFPDSLLGAGTFKAVRVDDQLSIEARFMPPDFTVPARALRAFSLSSSLLVDNDRMIPLSPEDDTPYFFLNGLSWQDWSGQGGFDDDAVYVTSSFGSPNAVFEWTVSAPGTYGVKAIWPDLSELVTKLDMATACYRVYLDDVQVGLAWTMDQNVDPGSWQTVGGVTVGGGLHTVRLEVSYAVTGGVLAVDAAKLE
jgi:hypothetical protein